MANVDITLRLTNPALYNQLQALVSHPHEIALQLNPNSIQQIHGQLQNISVPVSVTPTLNNPQQLVQQIQQAIGNISINVTIGNLAALNTQIQQLFAGLGINAQNVGTGAPRGPKAQKINTRALVNELARNIESGTPTAVQRGFLNPNRITQATTVQTGRQTGASYRSILSRSAIRRLDEAPAKRLLKTASIYSSQLGRGTLDLEFPQFLQQLEQAANNPAFQGTALGEKLTNTLEQLRFKNTQSGFKNLLGRTPQSPTTAPSTLLQRSAAQARLFDKTQALQGRQSKQQREFESGSLLDIAILGPERAARLFEEGKGLQAGSISTQGLSRFSFDLKRPFATKAARNELGFATLFGGLPGFIGGVAGGAAFGEGGIFQGSAIFQQAVNTITSTFDSIAGVLLKASKAGQEFQEAITSTSIALQATSKVVGPGGREASIGEAIAFQNERSKSLLGKATEQLSPLGVKPETVAATLRGVIQGTARTGIPFSEDQILKQVFTIAAFTAKTNEDLAANSGRLANAAEGLVAGETTPTELTRSLLGSKVAAPLRAAIQTGDAEAATKVFDSLAKSIKNMSETSVTFNTALGQVDTQLQSFQREFGNAFNEALVPGLTSFAKALNNPAFKVALKSLGEDLGKLLNIIIQGAASITKFLSENPQLVKTGTAATGGALAGAATGATAGFFLGGGLPGAAIGGLAGAVIGGLGGGLLGSKTIPKEGKTPTILQGFSTVPITSPEDDIAKLISQTSRNVDSGTISGRFREDRNALLKQQLSGSISPDVFDKSLASLSLQGKVDQTLASLNITKSALELGAFQEQNISSPIQATFRGRRKRGTVITDAEGNVTGGRQEFFGPVVEFSKTIQSVPPALESLKLAAEAATASLNDLSAERELAKLQGQDRLAALNRQIVEAGGTARISIGGPSVFETEGDTKARRLKILESQFDVESAKINPFRFEQESRAITLEREKKERDTRTAVDVFGTTSKIGEIQKQQELLGFLGKFSDAELKDNILLPDEKGGTTTGLELKEKLQKDLAKTFNTEVGTETFDKITKKLGSGGDLKDIGTKLDSLFDQLIEKIKSGTSQALKENFD